jgi:hypothetical protein
MRRIILLAVVALMALGGTANAAGQGMKHATTQTANVAAAPPVAHASCTRARILGKRKCIARGQFCTHSRRANRDYHRYGLHCGKRDANGNYHLVYY